jgi:transcriptional regulator of acetoin/glycerol metabolism
MMERLVAFSESGLISKTDVVRAFEETPGGVGSHRSLARQQMKSELEELLRETGGNLAEVARRLGMSRGAIIYRAQKFGLLPERRRRAGERGAAARSS